VPSGLIFAEYTSIPVLVIQRPNQTTRTVTPPITIESVERFIVAAILAAS
jgi:hypothetical protein